MTDDDTRRQEWREPCTRRDTGPNRLPLRRGSGLGIVLLLAVVGYAAVALVIWGG